MNLIHKRRKYEKIKKCGTTHKIQGGRVWKKNGSA